MSQDPKLQAAIERCAKLEAWIKLETNSARQEQARQQLVDAKEALYREIERVKREKATVQDGPTHVREINIRS